MVGRAGREKEVLTRLKPILDSPRSLLLQPVALSRLNLAFPPLPDQPPNGPDNLRPFFPPHRIPKDGLALKVLAERPPPVERLLLAQSIVHLRLERESFFVSDQRPARGEER